MLQDLCTLKRREHFAPNICHNPVGVDPDLSSLTQGRLADSPTLAGGLNPFGIAKTVARLSGKIRVRCKKCQAIGKIRQVSGGRVA